MSRSPRGALPPLPSSKDDNNPPTTTTTPSTGPTIRKMESAPNFNRPAVYADSSNTPQQQPPTLAKAQTEATLGGGTRKDYGATTTQQPGVKYGGGGGTQEHKYGGMSGQEGTTTKRGMEQGKDDGSLAGKIRRKIEDFDRCLVELDKERVVLVDLVAKARALAERQAALEREEAQLMEQAKPLLAKE